jgi:hypothetical protein
MKYISFHSHDGGDECMSVWMYGTWYEYEVKTRSWINLSPVQLGLDWTNHIIISWVLGSGSEPNIYHQYCIS